jgi:hypothetical protein
MCYSDVAGAEFGQRVQPQSAGRGRHGQVRQHELHQRRRQEQRAEGGVGGEVVECAKDALKCSSLTLSESHSAVWSHLRSPTFISDPEE